MLRPPSGCAFRTRCPFAAERCALETPPLRELEPRHWVACHFADATPVLLTAVYNVIPALDVQAAIGTDLTNSPGDALSFLVGARYYAGQL